MVLLAILATILICDRLAYATKQRADTLEHLAMDARAWRPVSSRSKASQPKDQLRMYVRTYVCVRRNVHNL